MNARRIVMVVVAAAAIFNVILALGDWAPVPSLWVWAGIASLVPVVSSLVVDPTTLRDRWKDKGRSIDPVRLRLAQLSQFTVLALAPLDVGRLHWSDTVPVALRVVALVLVACGYGLVMWSMHANRFFMPAIRIQEDRGHQLVTGGPYRYVRHPGYAGIVLVMLTTGLAVGSWIAALLGLVPAFLFAVRAAYEDRFLHAQLAGYPAFAGQTRFRLVPGVW